MLSSANIKAPDCSCFQTLHLPHPPIATTYMFIPVTSPSHLHIGLVVVSHFLLRFNVSHTTTTTTTPKPLKITVFCPLTKCSNHAPSEEMLVAVFQLVEILVQK
jgi:hypothetical protein